MSTDYAAAPCDSNPRLSAQPPSESLFASRRSQLFVLSARLSLDRGAYIHDAKVTLRDDVMTTHPIEADSDEGLAKGCPLNLLGPVAPLKLAGGSAQLLTYTIAAPAAQARTGHGPPERGGPRVI